MSGGVLGCVAERPRLLISFSGGETSAYMTWLLLNRLRHQYSDIVAVFANTGQENEETLEFVRDCDRHFGFSTVWIEGVQFPGERKSASFRVVDFDTASRNGEPFEAVIAKYGIPNQKFPHCTRDTKLYPIEAYARSLGWAAGEYRTAIGIRADEIDRMSSSAGAKGLEYPLIKAGITKPHVNLWFSRQPFRLRLKGYRGNCKWCWKKSFRKHLTTISENPEAYDFPRRMEATYGMVGPEFRKGTNAPGYSRTFFRGNRSVGDLFLMRAAAGDAFVPAEDDAITLPEPELFDIDLDTPGGCGETCEIWSDLSDAEELIVAANCGPSEPPTGGTLPAGPTGVLERTPVHSSTSALSGEGA